MCILANIFVCSGRTCIMYYVGWIILLTSIRSSWLIVLSTPPESIWLSPLLDLHWLLRQECWGTPLPYQFLDPCILMLLVKFICVWGKAAVPSGRNSSLIIFSLLRSALYKVKRDTPAFFSLESVWCVFPHPITLNLYWK